MEPVQVASRQGKFICPFETGETVILNHMENVMWNGQMTAYYICPNNEDHRLSHNLSTGQWQGNMEILHG